MGNETSIIMKSDRKIPNSRQSSRNSLQQVSEIVNSSLDTTIPLSNSLIKLIDRELEQANTYLLENEVEFLFSDHDRNILSHSFTLITYIIKGSSGQPEFRSFFIELFVNEENKKVLSIKKMNQPREGYHSNNYFITKMKMKDIFQIAENLMLNSGEYNLFLFNCRHFTKLLLETLQTSSKTLKLKFNPSDIDRYYEKYPRQPNYSTTTYISFSELLEKFPLDEKEKKEKPKVKK